MSTKVVTGKVRASFVHVFTPTAIEDGQEKKYSVSLIIPKSDKVTLGKIEKAIEEAKEDLKTKNGGTLPKKWWNPLKDGDEEREDEAYQDSMYVSAKSNRRPGVVDKDLQEIIDPEEVYSGCFIRADLNFYAFVASANKGIAVGLNNIQKLEEGERLGGGGRTAAEAFGEEEDIL